MDAQGQRQLLVLQEVEENPALTQRVLAKKLGMALGLSNLCLKRLARKGYIKISTLPRSRLRYILTPNGMAEKSRLTYQYFQHSLTYYRDIRRQFQQTLAHIEHLGGKRIVVFGVGELAELAYLSIRDRDLTLVGFVDDEPRKKFLSYPCGTIESLHAWDFDAVLISHLGNVAKIQAKLRHAGIVAQKIVTVV